MSSDEQKNGVGVNFGERSYAQSRSADAAITELEPAEITAVLSFPGIRPEGQWIHIVPLDELHVVLNRMPLNGGAHYVSGDVVRVEPATDGKMHTVTVAHAHPFQYQTFPVTPAAATSPELQLLARTARVEGVEMYLHGALLKVRLPRKSAYDLEAALKQISILAPEKGRLDFPQIPEPCTVREAQALLANAGEALLGEASVAAGGLAVSIAGKFATAGRALRDLAAFLETVDEQGRGVLDLEFPLATKELAKDAAESLWRLNQRLELPTIRTYYEFVCRLGGIEPTDESSEL